VRELETLLNSLAPSALGGWSRSQSIPSTSRGDFSTDRRHTASEKITGVERGASWLLGRVRMIGTDSTRWAETTIQTRGVQGMGVVQGLLSLTHRHDSSAIEQACRVAHGYGSYRLRTIRALIDR
jgi:hypothetical protein